MQKPIRSKVLRPDLIPEKVKSSKAITTSTSMPTIKEYENNFIQASKRAFASLRERGIKRTIVSKDIFKRRLAVCRKCKFWDEKARLGLGKCNHERCGCTKMKLWLTTEECPLRKWS